MNRQNQVFLRSFCTPLLVPLVFLHPQTCLASFPHGARVQINEVLWENGGCPTPTSAMNPANPPVMFVGCSIAYASAGGENVYATGHLCDGPEITDLAQVGIEDHGTGATITETAPGYWSIQNPKHKGSITVKSTIHSECNVADDCEIRAAVTFEAVGTLTVIDIDEAPATCSSCTAATAAAALGNGSVNSSRDGQLDFRLMLGTATEVSDAGMIVLQADSGSSALATPTALNVPYEANSLVLTNGSGLLRQVKCPQGLVNVKTIDSYQYDLQCFYDGDVVQTPQPDGFYATNSGAQTFVTWKVKNPDAATATNRLTITEVRGSDERVFQFTNSAVSLRWDLGRPDGSVVSSWREQVSSGVTNFVRQVTSGPQVVQKRQETYQYVMGLSYPLLIQTVDGDAGATETNSYQYYSSNPTNNAYTNKLQRVDYPDGRWSYFTYDNTGRTQKVYSAYGSNAPPASGEPDGVTNQCRVMEYYYTLTSGTDGVDDNGSFGPFVARKVLVKVPVGGSMEEVARMLHIVPTNTMDEVEICPLPGAHWGDSGNVRELTYRYTINDPHMGKPISISHGDGTVTLYEYTIPGAVSATITGEADNWTSPSSIVNGSRADTSFNSLGQIQSQLTTAIQSGSGNITVASNGYCYTIGGSPIDALSRSYDLVDMAGQKTQYRYSCCGLDYVIDPDGATTYYDYDVLKRQVAAMRVFGGGNGIKTTNVLDAAGEILLSQRIGTDGSVITLSQVQYDFLRRPMRQTNALLGVTVITNAIVNNRRCVTNTFADGGTRIETYYRDGRLESVSGTAVSPLCYHYGAEQDGVSGPWREFTLEQKLDSSGGTNEWVKTLYDGTGRPYKTVYAASTNVFPYRLISYNSLDQKVAERDPDGVTTLFAYNSKGELVRSVVDMNQNGLIDPTDGNGVQDDDRITDTLQDVLATGASGNSRGTDITRTRIFNFTTMDAVATNLIHTIETSTDGLRSWRTVQQDSSTAVTTFEKTDYGANGYRTNTMTNPDGTRNVTLFLYGRPLSVTRRDSSGNQVTQKTYSWDTHGRLLSTTDARNGVTSYGYNAGDKVTTTTSPDAGLGPQVITTAYDNMGRTTSVTQPDSSVVFSEYHPAGLLKKTSGSRTYAVGYGYDAQGRMRYMTNWQSFALGGGTEITRWNYDAYRGWLKSKDYPDASTGNPPGTEGTTGPTYTYTDAGRLLTRTWKRGVGSTNSHNHAGELSAVTYSDSTPSVAYSYDRRGRRLSVICNSITTSYTYNDADQALTEGYSGGTLNGLSVSNVFDGYLRRIELNAKNDATLLQGAGYAYGVQGRLGTVTDNSATSYTISYGYEPNSTLVNAITNKQSGAVRLLTTKQYDKLNRLSLISSVGSGSSAPTLSISYQYQYNSANQRTRLAQEDGSYWIYGYDSLGQVTSGNRYWPDGTAVDGQQFEYSFDDMGNRVSTGGRVSSQSSYTQNRLNQYTQRTVPGVMDIQGIANPTASVTVNGNTADRHGEYFHYSLSVANSSAAYPTITVASAYGSGQSTSGKIFVPPATETYSYDDDGNLTTDGRWVYTWDAENRIIQMIRDTDSPNGARQKLTFEYDYVGRRIRKKFYTYGSGWVLNADTIFLYDGWNLIAELDASLSNAPLRTYIWGLDFRGTKQSAGGIGGLAKVTDYTSGTTHHFIGYDGNGNIGALFDGSTATLTARYENGPFGEPLRTTGSLAKLNPFRFSTKFQDNETTYVYYGHRTYNPSTGRWTSRDPVAERGGMNLYAFVNNSCCTKVDYLGLLSQDYRWTDWPLLPSPTQHDRDGETWPTSGGGPYGGALSSGISYQVGTSSVGCCCQVHVYNTKWGAAGWYNPQNPSAESHELHHYKIIHDAFDHFVNTVKPFNRVCMTCPAADCYRGIVGAIAAAAYAEQDAGNIEYDCNTYGDGCQSAPFRREISDQQWESVRNGLKACADLNKQDPKQ